MRRAPILLAVIMFAFAAPASASALRIPGWAKPLLSQLAGGMPRPYATVVTPPVPAPLVPSVHGFSCFIAQIGSAIADGAGFSCDRPATALPIWAPLAGVH